MACIVRIASRLSAVRAKRMDARASICSWLVRTSITDFANTSVMLFMTSTRGAVVGADGPRLVGAVGAVGAEEEAEEETDEETGEEAGEEAVWGISAGEAVGARAVGARAVGARAGGIIRPGGGGGEGERDDDERVGARADERSPSRPRGAPIAVPAANRGP